MAIAELFHQHAHETGEGRFGPGPVAKNVYLRLERQTLRKLPESGDILFTIRIYIDPLSALETHPEGASLAAGHRRSGQGPQPRRTRLQGACHRTRPKLLARLEMIGRKCLGLSWFAQHSSAQWTACAEIPVKEVA
jgi:hypothetical protein